ncbi:hypothetical protein DFH08DRAFT_769695 [Mycena albidolilacea]|uniref:BTB domain-containing protein n=1 Tax=Mycena albidolilacea TaxID=1033008 RepID=A0AAD7F1J7_9AGAR|nr:hypothetical protein DFH08DRAFT_769695 [Mycena albidolilacea]
MSDTPPAKRKRTTDSSPDPDTTPVRSKIWMPYGDIILQAEFTQFRVNRDVLAQNSSVFADMLSVPLPPDEPTVEGCPIVRVTDTAEDWKLLLDVLYHPFQDSASRPFAVVAAMLRLGSKYDIPQARNDALSRLHFEYPADLRAWHISNARLTKIAAHQLEGFYPDLLNLLYECGIDSCIPTAGLHCLNSYTLDALFTGVQRHDGTSVTLSNANKLTLAVALERILLFQKSTLRWLDGNAVVPHKSCKSSTTCTREKIVINHMVTWETKERLDSSFLLGEWDSSWSNRLCDVCELAAREYTDVSVQKGWELLPTFFGLP